MKHEHTYLTKSEAAEYLRCSLRTIDYLRDRNALKTYRLAGKLLFARDDLDALVRGEGEKDSPQCDE